MFDSIDCPSLARLRDIAIEAGKATLPYFYEQRAMCKQAKDDGSVVTGGDLASDLIIREGLTAAFPDIPVLTEETAKEYPWSVRRRWQSYWLVDPLDGTRGFVEADPNYTVNIALIQNNRPVFGIIYAPPSEALYFASNAMGAAYQQHKDGCITRLHTSTLDWQSWTAVVGRFHDNDSRLDHIISDPAVSLSRINSSYKFCLLANGQLDSYPKLSRTAEWDTAAGQVILEQAGGVLCNTSGLALTYNTKESLINPPFLALGDTAVLDDMLANVFGDRADHTGESNE